MTECKAIVTGGARGIGFAVSSSLLEAGGKVCILDVLALEGTKAQKTFDEKYGSGKAFFLQCDVSKKDQLHDAFHKAKSLMSGLNVVFNNAGVVYNHEERNHIDEMVSINLGAVIHGSMLGLELMGRSYGGDGGVIINASSSVGLYHWIPVYSSTKTAVVHFSRCIAETFQVDNDVRVNCICPHFVYTELLKDTFDTLWKGKMKIPEDQLDVIPKNDEELHKQALEPSEIGSVIMELINDESKNGLIQLIERKSQEESQNLVIRNLDFK